MKLNKSDINALPQNTCLLSANYKYTTCSKVSTRADPALSLYTLIKKKKNPYQINSNPYFRYRNNIKEYREKRIYSVENIHATKLHKGIPNLAVTVSYVA